MTLLELRNNLLRLLWLEYPSTAPNYIYEDVTTAINSAYQLIHQSQLDYFRKEEVDVTFSVAENEKDLWSEADVSEVIGPLWIPLQGDRELQQIIDQSEFNQLFRRYYGFDETEAVSKGVPEATYYLVKSRRSYSEDAGKDSSQCILAIKPVPSSPVTIRMIVAKRPPELSVSEVRNAVGTEVLSIPNDAVETILLPVARWYAMRSHFFYDTEKTELIQQDYSLAMASLGLNNPEKGTQSHMAEMLSKRVTPRTRRDGTSTDDPQS